MPEDKFLIGNSNYPLNKNKDKLHTQLKELLNVKNVSFLFGNGASMMLGAPNIGSVRNLLPEIKKENTEETTFTFLENVLSLFPPKEDIGDTDFESLLGTLYSLNSLSQTLSDHQLKIDKIEITKEALDALIVLLKKFLYNKCKKLPTKKPDFLDNELDIHISFFRKLLLRSQNLPRVKIFTLNYDTLIEKSLDSLGVSCFDGFSGTVDRRLQPESYNYDLYFPGETTEGRIERVDRVLHLYKLHGSINWLKVQRTRTNIWGIKQGTPGEEQYGDLMIYPSPLKEGEILGYPYSEMFRHFSFSIHKPQSVLFAIGYSFNDNHINQLIYQSFSIPSFRLVIITPEIPGNNSNELNRIVSKVKSDRVVVITGAEERDGEYISGAGTFQGFTQDWMPDVQELDVEKKVNTELEGFFKQTPEFTEESKSAPNK